MRTWHTSLPFFSQFVPVPMVDCCITMITYITVYNNLHIGINMIYSFDHFCTSVIACTQVLVVRLHLLADCMHCGWQRIYVDMWQLQEHIWMNKGTCTQRKDSERRRQTTDRRKDRPTDVQTEIDRQRMHFQTKESQPDMTRNRWHRQCKERQTVQGTDRSQ